MEIECFDYWSQRARFRLRRRALLRSVAAGGATLAAGSFIGCSGRKAGTGAVGGTPAAQQRRKGGTLTVNLGEDPPGWSILLASGNTATVHSFAYENLTVTASGPGHPANSTDLVPQLASAMPEQPDPQTYIYKLRQGVKFQNIAPVSGRPLTIDDVKFSLDTLNAAAAFKSDFGAVSSVTTPDAETLVVKTSRPDATLLNTTSGHYGWRIFPKEIMENKLGDTNAIGSGPFVRTEWQQGNRIIFKRNPDYWDPSVPLIDEFHYLIIPDPNTAAAAFQTKQLDILTGALSCVQNQTLLDSVKGFATTQDSYLESSDWWAFNTTKAPFNDIRVRQALSRVFNRAAVRQALYCGDALQTALLPNKEALKPADLPDLVANLKYDPKGAKDLMNAAGFPNGFHCDMVWTPRDDESTGGTYSASLQAYVGDLKQIGITLNLISLDYAKWIGEVYRPPYNFNDMLWAAGKVYYPDPNTYVFNWLHPKGVTNESRVNDPALTALIEKQQTQLNAQERWDTIHQIQMMDAKGAYYAYKENAPQKIYAQNHVHDYVDHNSPSKQEFRYVWLDA